MTDSTRDYRAFLVPPARPRVLDPRPPAAPGASRRASTGYVLFTLLLLIGAYVDVGLELTGVPMLSVLPAVAIGLFIFRARLLTVPTMYAFGIAVAVWSWSLMAPDLADFFLKRLVALGQFFYSILVGLVLFWTVSSYSSKSIVRFLNIALTIYIVLLVLELFTPFSKVIDAYMSVAFAHDTTFQTIINNRDEGVGFGFRRPKMFLSETSHVAMWFSFMLGIKAFLDPSQRNLLPNLLIAVLGLGLIRSPIAGMGMLYVFLAYALNVTRNSEGGVRVFILAVFGLLLLALLGFVEALVFSERLATASSGSDYSTTFRTYGSFYAAWAVAREHPLFGVGIGSIDLASKPVINSFLSLQIPAYIVIASWRDQIQNLFAALVVYLGWPGAALAGVAVVGYWRAIAGRLEYPFWALFALMSCTYSAFYSPKFMVFIYLFLAVNAVYSRERRQAAMTRTTPRRRAPVASLNLRG